MDSRDTNSTLGGILTTCNTTLGGIFAQKPLHKRKATAAVRARDLRIRSRALHPFDYDCTCVATHYLSSPRPSPPAKKSIRFVTKRSIKKSTRFCQGACPILTTCLTIFDCQSQMLAHWDNLKCLDTEMYRSVFGAFFFDRKVRIPSTIWHNFIQIHVIDLCKNRSEVYSFSHGSQIP